MIQKDTRKPNLTDRLACPPKNARKKKAFKLEADLHPNGMQALVNGFRDHHFYLSSHSLIHSLTCS